MLLPSLSVQFLIEQSWYLSDKTCDSSPGPGKHGFEPCRGQAVVTWIPFA